MSARPLDVAEVKERLKASSAGYEVVYRSRGLEVQGTPIDPREGHAVFVPVGADHRFVGYEQLSVLVIFERSE